MESRDPFLRVSVPKVSGLVSVAKVSGLETLNIPEKWFNKISIILIFLCVAFTGKKQPKHVGKMPEIWKNSSQKHGRLQKLFQGGATRYFAYPFHVADDAVEMHVHKTLATQGRNKGWQGGHNSPGAETLWGCQSTVGVAIKSQQCHKYFLQCNALASERSQVRTWDGKPASCPGRHLTSLRPCCYGSSRKNRASLAQQCFFFIHASFHTAQYKTTKLTTISSHCLAAFSAKDVCVQQSHAAKRPRP